MVQRDDGFQDEADKVNEEVKAERDAVELGAHVGKDSRPPVVLDDPAAVAVEPPMTPSPAADIDAGEPEKVPPKPGPVVQAGEDLQAAMAARGRNRAEGRPQTGIPQDPDPRAAESGMRASSIAGIAYDATQRYKEQIGQTYKWWVDLEETVQGQIVESVKKMMRGDSVGAATLHTDWAANMIEAGANTADDPRLLMAYGQLDDVERRKCLIFAKVVVALTQVS